MFIYYLKFAWRHLHKNIGYSLINITGLTLGLASVLLIFLYTQYEFSYDSYHEEKDRIYRLIEHGFEEDGARSWLTGNLAPEMRTSFTGVEDAVRLSRVARCGLSTEIRVREKLFEDLRIRCTESNIFNIFSFPLVAGSENRTLDAPNTAVISRSLANKVFGEENPVGKTFRKKILLEGEKTFEITAVMADIPEKTHFTADLLISYNSQSQHAQQQAHSIYVLLEENADKEVVAEQALRHLRTLPGQERIQRIELQPLEDIYLSGIHAERLGNIQYIYILSAIALIILIIACANYMNLATARYSRRSKEIGVRKVLGAHRTQLVRQFLFETVLLTLVALPFAVLLVRAALPYFNVYVGTSLDFESAQTFGFYLAAAGLVLFTGLLAGSYPAFVSSALKAKEVIAGAGMTQLGFTGNRLRKGVVGFQFMASIVLIGMTAVVIRQLSFVQERDLGFNPGNVITVNITEDFFGTEYNALKQKFKQVPSVSGVTASTAPGTGLFAGQSMSFTPNSATNEEIDLRIQKVDPDFLSVMDIPFWRGAISLLRSATVPL